VFFGSNSVFATVDDWTVKWLRRSRNKRTAMWDPEAGDKSAFRTSSRLTGKRSTVHPSQLSQRWGDRQPAYNC
jgi:hypothetical protein